MRVRLGVLLLFSILLAACAGILGIKPTSVSHPFEHRAHVLKGVACTTCHAGIGAAGDKGPLHFPTAADCVRCHEKPHDARPCGTCHGEAHVRGGAELAREHLTFAHDKHMPAVRGDCVRCHQAVATDAPEALRPPMATCFGCHQHRDQWRVRDCDGCHADLPHEGTPPASHLVHEGDFVREHGVKAASARDLCAACHSERSCAGCHGAGLVPALPARMTFDAPKLSGLHRAGFASRHAEEARAQPGLCTTCHAESTCRSCHAGAKVSAGVEGARSPHPRGWLSADRGGGRHGRDARTDPTACASCHGGAGEALCVGCHRSGGPGGSPHGRGFTSTKDKSRDVPCRACHGAGR